MKVAALDLGSNTFLLLVCDVENGQVKSIYRDEIQVTKLGQGVHANKKFHPDALIRAEECLREFSEMIRAERPERVLAVATSAARDVSNGQELFKIGDKYGIPIQIIPGHLEAQITFEGATYDIKDKEGLAAIDVGGGSTEVISLGPDGRTSGVSVDVGSVRLTEMFVTGHPIAEKEVKSIVDYAEKKFLDAKAQIPKNKLREVIGVAGTPTTLAAVIQNQPYKDELVHGFKISIETLEEWLYKLAKMDLNTRKSLVGMDPLRADVIVAGTAVLIAAMRSLKTKLLTVSTRGVRYGVALYAAAEKK